MFIYSKMNDVWRLWKLLKNRSDSINSVNFLAPGVSDDQADDNPEEDCKMVKEVHERPDVSILDFAGGEAGKMEQDHDDEGDEAHDCVKGAIKERWHKREHAWC